MDNENKLGHLVMTDTRLELRLADYPKSLFVDFLSKQLTFRRRSGGGVRQLLAKAVGIRSDYRPTILDATAGLGVDGFILASLGCQVQWLERSPLLAALLQDGLRRLEQTDSALASRLSLNCVDAHYYLSQPHTSVDVIYLDPMFPKRVKSALNKQSMRILSSLVGDDSDADGLWELAMQSATKRVVVKRPRGAPCLGGQKADWVFHGKSNRFDVYFICSVTGQPL